MGADRSVARRALAPRFLPIHLLAIAAVGFACWLGWWQYDAFQADRAAAARSLTEVAPIPLSDAFGPDDPFPGLDRGRPVEVQGTWLTDDTFLVADRERSATDDTIGFWVVTPIAVDGPDGAAFPVVLGWSAQRTLPTTLPTGQADTTAWLQQPEAGLPDDDPTDRIVPTLVIAEVIQQLDRDAYGGFGIATEPLAGLDPVSADAETETDWSTGARNLFYAFEWWFFGGFAVFVWWRYLRDELSDGAH